MEVLGGSIWLFVFLLLVESAGFLLMTVLWLRSMHRALESCHKVSRSTEPDSVWLIFIPVFGFFWMFIINTKVSESLAREYHRRGWHSDEDLPGKELGIVACVVVCIVVVLRSVFAIHPGISFIGTFAICFFMYRHMDRLNSFRERLEKEYDPTTAFGQIPLTPANLNFGNVISTIPLGPPPIYVNPIGFSQTQIPAYAHIPFVPEIPFHPIENNTTASEKSADDSNGIPEELKKWMPRNENPV